MISGEKFVRGVLQTTISGLLVGCSSGALEPAPDEVETTTQSLTAPYITASARVCSAATGDKCGVTLQWDTGSTQPNSRVFRRLNGGTWTALTCVSGAKGSFTVNDRSVNTVYDFALRAVNSSCGGSTNIAQTTVRVSDSMLTRLANELRYQGKAYRDIGVMKLDLFQQFLNIADAPKPQALDALDKAAAHGIKVMTVLAAPWWPADLTLWDNTPQQYWAAFDEMLAAADAEGIKMSRRSRRTLSCSPITRGALFPTRSPRPRRPRRRYGRARSCSNTPPTSPRVTRTTRVCLYWNLAFQLDSRRYESRARPLVSSEHREGYAVEPHHGG